MFARLMDWLHSFFKRGSGYSDRERNIFSYSDGHKTLKADPVVLYRNIMEKWPELKADFNAAACTIPNQWTGKAQKESVAKLRVMFFIKPLRDALFVDLLDGTLTLTDMEVMDLFNGFMIWCEEQKKSTRQIPTYVRETSAPIEPISTGVLPIENGSVSGSIEKEQPIEQLTSSLLEPSSPSVCSTPE